MFYYVARAICWLLLKIFWRVEVKGIDNIPKNGGLILASNHVSYLDPIVLGISIKRKIYFIAKKEAFNNFFGSLLLHNLNAFPVDRGKTDILAFKKAINILKEGKILGIFPEGTRSSNGELQELKIGPQGKKFPVLFKYKIIINYGIPQYFTDVDLKDKESQKEVINLLSNKIRELSNLNITK